MKNYQLYSLAVVVMVTLVGCDDGTVEVTGRIEIDGVAATNGQLILNPVGDGAKGFGGVAEDGRFRLFSQGSKKGIPAGSYHVLFKHQVELSESARKTLSKRAGGLPVDELSESYSSPRKSPVEIPAEGTDDLLIAISRKAGWNRSVSD